MKPASILVADDESNIRLTLRVALETDGYLVREASNGREALEAIEKQPPDLVVLDLNMPVVDGVKVLEEMKLLTLQPKPRVMVLTAFSSIPIAVKATRLGAVEFMEKPINPTELRQTVRSILTEPEFDAAPNADSEIAGNSDEVLAHIRALLRLTDYSNAESLLEKAAVRKTQHMADYFNLLGVLYEAQRKWRLARKCYAKAIAADKQFEPAQANMRRLFELQTYGRSTQAVMLGDEADEVRHGSR